MELIDVQRTVVDRVALSVGQPLFISPLVSADIIDFRSGTGTKFGMESIRVRLDQNPSISGMNREFVQSAGLQSGFKPFPETVV